MSPTDEIEAHRVPIGGSGPASAAVPRGLRVTAAVCWRFLVIAGALYVLGRVVGALQVVVIPVALALLLSALLVPVVRLLTRWRVPRGLACGIAIIGGFAALGGILYGVVTAFIAGLSDLQAQVGRSVAQITGWLADGPLHISRTQLDGFVNGFGRTLQDNRAALTSGALGVASTVGEIVTGAFLALFTLIFFLYDGRKIWRFLLRAVPQHSRDGVDVAGQRAFASLVGYTRAVALVAVVDAVGIGIGLWVIRVPLVIPLAALVFLGAFVPTVGAVLSGVVAVLVALVADGFIPALLVLGVVIAVQQLEGHVLQPLLLGRAVRLHPLAVVLPVATGVVVAGVVGALLAVPLVAVLNSGIRSLIHSTPTDPSTVDPVDPRQALPGAVAAAATRRLRLRRPVPNRSY